MTFIIKLRRLPLSAKVVDIREYFRGLSIPKGGVSIVGGENGNAFIKFSLKMTTPSVPSAPSVPSVRQKANSEKTKLLWRVIAYKVRNVRAAEHFEKSVELLRRKKVLAKLLECNAGPAVIGPLFAARERRARPVSNMESVAPNVCATNPMTWVRNNNAARANETREVVPAMRTRHSPYSLDNRRVRTRKDDHAK